MDEMNVNGGAQPAEEIDVGSVKISPDVISAIAYVATTEIEGVAGMAQNITGGIAELLGKKNVARGIKVEVTDGAAFIEAYIVVQYGAVIPEVTAKLQERIKQNVETMTGMTVEQVNIHVQGVKFDAPEQPAAEEAAKTEANEEASAE